MCFLNENLTLVFRFLEALKRNLREKIEKLNIELPPLCCCAPTVWDTNPDTCANNCTFYRNHKGKC